MTKRSPKKESKQRPSEANKRLQALKTALPLVVTLLLLGVVYLMVLLPDSPEMQLKSAILNSVDSDKQKSFRYDGTYVDTNRTVDLEFSGQVSSSDSEVFRSKYKYQDKSFSLEAIRYQSDSYYRIEGVNNYDQTVGRITGANKLTDQQYGVLTAIQSKWIRVPIEQASMFSSALACVDNLPINWDSKLVELSPENYPFSLTAGPYDDGDNKVYEAKIVHDKFLTGPEANIINLTNCLENQYASDDSRLRGSSKADLSSLRFNFTVDPLSNTVKKMIVKQVGQKMEFNIHDYNKDVSLSAPEGSITVSELIQTLPPDQQTLLLSSFLN